MNIMKLAAGDWQVVRLFNTPTTVKLPIYLQLMFGMAVVIGLVAISLAALTRLNTLPSHLFPSDLLNLVGASERTVKLMGFSCHPQADVFSNQYCTHAPTTGPFSLVLLTLSDRAVMRVNFTIRKDAVVVGDLPLEWGRPKIARYGKSVHLEWPQVGATANGQVGYGLFSYFLPLTRISFANAKVINPSSVKIFSELVS